jgi:hypothetical protein
MPPSAALLDQKLDQVLANQAADRELVTKVLDDHEKRIRVVEAAYARLSERLTLWQMFQASFTTIVGAISTIVSTVLGHKAL